MHKLQVFLDTNTLLLPGVYRIDVLGEIARLLDVPYEVVILDIVLDELRRLTVGKSKDAQAAKLGLSLAKSWISKKEALLKDTAALQAQLHPIEKHLNADLVFEKMVSGVDCIVATQDRELRQKIAKTGAKTLIMRQKSHFELI